MQTKDNRKDPKTDIRPVRPKKKMGPKKMYLCVVGIDKDLINDTVFYYLEGRSKMEIVFEESLRTEDNPEHAVIVFEDQIDLKVLKQACNTKRLNNSELKFDVIDPPMSVIVSSDDDKLTVKGVTDFLTKKKLENLNVRTKEEGSISVKFKHPEGVTEILKSTGLKIGGSNVFISVKYKCDHGTYWDHSLHRKFKRKKRIQTQSMKIQPIEVTLILKENKFKQLKNIAPDFTYDVDVKSGRITLTGVKEDISEAKLAVFEVKHNYYTWKMTTLSCNQCRLIKNKAVVDILEQSLSDKNIRAVFDIRENEVLVCTTCQDECKPVENIFKETVVEDEIRLDDTSKNVLRLDEWAKQKVNITNHFRDVSYVDDSADDRIIVVATYNVLDEIMKDLDNFVEEHSINDKTIKIKDKAELKYFKLHLKDWVKELEFKNNDQGLRIEFDNQFLQLSGVKQAITTASSEIHSQMRKIQKNQHTITKAGVDSLFNDQSKTDVLLSPIEEGSKTVIIVDQNSLTKAPLHRNPVRKESDEDWVRRQPSKYFNRKDKQAQVVIPSYQQIADKQAQVAIPSYQQMTDKQAFLDKKKNRVPPKTGALHGFATEETSTHTAVTVKDKQKQVIKSSNQQMRSVSFWIYSMSQRETNDAKEQLDKAVLEKYKTEKFHDRLISELTEKELSYLLSVENNYPKMCFTIDQRSSEITIEGIAEYATSAKQDMLDWFRKFAHMRFCQAEAEIFKEQVQWYMKYKDPTFGTMTLEPYPPMENMHLENAYKGNSNRTDVDFKDEYGEEYIIDLATMTQFPKKNPKDRRDVIRREILYGHGGTFDPPKEWIDQGTDNVKVVRLSNTTPEYQSIEKRFTTSVKNGKFAKTSPDVINKKVTVTKIERIQNLNLFRMYAAKRSLMEKQNQNVKNEQELWHGTPESAVVSINHYGFNRCYCTANSDDPWWGLGVHFVNDASYSVRDFLTRPGVGGTSQERNIYLCRVLTGVSHKGIKHEPLRYLPLRLDGTMLPYDSNMDDLSPPMIYVIFNDTQAYPLYQIKFTLT